MDTLLANGDFYTDDRGLPVAVEGVQELIQRALFRLTTRKGAFALDTGLGSDLHKLSGQPSEQLTALAQAAVEQALLPVTGITAEQVSCTPLGEGGLRLDLMLTANGVSDAVSVVL